MAVTAKKEEGPRSFAVFVQGLAEGDCNAEMSRELQRLGQVMKREAEARGEEVPGAITLTIKGKADPRGTVHFLWDVKVTEPKPKRVGGAMWISRDGNFVSEDPRQKELFPREVKGPTTEAAIDLGAERKGEV
jgi:hypothetical protein